MFIREKYFFRKFRCVQLKANGLGEKSVSKSIEHSPRTEAGVFKVFLVKKPMMTQHFSNCFWVKRRLMNSHSFPRQTNSCPKDRFENGCLETFWLAPKRRKMLFSLFWINHMFAKTFSTVFFWPESGRDQAHFCMINF